jgi:pyruvate dehydrogenase E2 component (dihydrolipoamide acetyltransferase)
LSTIIEIKVPDIGDIEDAEIIEVLISVGDSIEKDDTMIVLETEKATMDIPSSASGVVKEILCKVGDKVAFDSVVFILEDSVAEVETPEAETVEVEAEKAETPEAEAPEVEAIKGPQTKAVSQMQEINLPDIGDDGAVEVIEVQVKIGDSVEQEDTLMVLETEKATMDIPAPLAGKIVDFKISVGDKVSTGDLIAMIEAISDDAEVPVVNKPETTQPPVAKSEAAESQSVKVEPAKVETAQPQPAKTESANKGLVHASPAIRRFARELGVNLSVVKGSGPKGRIVKIDVEQFVKAELAKPQSSSTASTSGLPQMPVIDFNKFGETESLPLSKIQKISSTNLHRNWVSIPHVTQHDDADITEMEAFRKAMKAEALNEGVKLTPLAFMLKAVVASLKAYPRFNSSLSADGETLIMKKYFNIGVAVETPDGLVVPVVKDVDKKSIYELATDLAELSAKARDKKLGIDGMQGSCFTISSLGGIGGTSFTPIVNWPDVAILGVSKSSMKPIWNGTEFEPRLMLPLSLSYDHRVIDGAVAARFVTHLSRTLGDIRRLTL